jgi:hypothetical protein
MTHHAVGPPLAAGIASLLLSGLMALLAGEPLPQFHDEFSYRLAAETFASGRLSNPTPEHAEHFESFQVLVRPSYMSKYPPAQGLVMALGLVIAGSAIVGVWLSTAAASAAVAWTLQARLPRAWALVGGLIAASHPLTLRWSSSDWHWGGSVALLGGALLIGAALRLARRITILDATIAAVGIAVLANARPYEGFVLTTLVTLGLAWVRCRDRATPGRRGETRATRLAAAAAAGGVLIANLAWMGLYNHAVTGSITTLPYVAYERQYALTPPLVFLTPPADAKTYASETMRVYYEQWERPQFQKQDTPAEFIATAGEKLQAAGKALVRGWHDWDAPVPAMVNAMRLGVAAPLLALPWLLTRSRTARRVAMLVVAFLGFALLALWFFPHYAAPIGAAIAFLHVASLRRLSLATGRRGVGRLLLIVVLLAHALDAATHVHRLGRGDFTPWSIGRFALLEDLSRDGSRWLVLVRSPSDRVVHDEWVYNGPDLASQPVVVARELDPGSTAALVTDARRAGRRVLRVVLDEPTPRVEEVGSR